MNVSGLVAAVVIGLVAGASAVAALNVTSARTPNITNYTPTLISTYRTP